MCIFEVHVNFTSVEVNQFGEEAIPMHQQGTLLDLPRYTGKICQMRKLITFANVLYYSVKSNWFRVFLFKFYVFLML